MPHRRKVRKQVDRPTPGDLVHAPETDAVRLPLPEERHRGEREDRISEREPRALRTPQADAVGEGNVDELATELDDESVRALEKNAQKTSPRAASHPRKS